MDSSTLFQRKTWPLAGKKASEEHLQHDITSDEAQIYTFGMQDQYRVSHGYYVPYYGAPISNATTKQINIFDQMRRFFHVAEGGIDVSSTYEDIQRDYAQYQSMEDPEAKRVLGALVVGAMFVRAGRIEQALLMNRATGLRLQDSVSDVGGRDLSPDEAAVLMKQLHEFGRILMTNKPLINCVQRHNNHEDHDGLIAEIIRETFKAYSQDTQMVARDTTLKIGATMQAIDETADIARSLLSMFDSSPAVARFIKEKHPELAQKFDAFVDSARARTGIRSSDIYYSDMHIEYTKSKNALFKEIAHARNTARGYKGPGKHDLMTGMKFLSDGIKIISDMAQTHYPMNASAYLGAPLSERPKSSVELFKDDVQALLGTPRETAFTR